MKLKEAEIKARELINKYCPEYTFKWSSGLNRFGYCNWRKQEISLSSVLTKLNNEEEVTNVILHEIAHALNPKQYHNKVWQRTAISIGCNGSRTCRDSVVAPKAKWIGICPKCGRKIYRNSRRKISCGKCSPVFNKDLLFKYVKNL
jgi:predicted SprT family Zn-dependent metalloprotease